MSGWTGFSGRFSAQRVVSESGPVLNNRDFTLSPIKANHSNNELREMAKVLLTSEEGLKHIRKMISNGYVMPL